MAGNSRTRRYLHNHARRDSPSTKGKAVNCFALLSRDNRCFFRTTEQTIEARLVCDFLDQFSHGLRRPSVVVLDNAPAHQGEMTLARSKLRGIYRNSAA